MFDLMRDETNGGFKLFSGPQFVVSVSREHLQACERLLLTGSHLQILGFSSLLQYFYHNTPAVVSRQHLAGSHDSHAAYQVVVGKQEVMWTGL